MFLKYLAFIFYSVSWLGLLVCLATAVFFLLKAKNGMRQQWDIKTILSKPTVLLYEKYFDAESDYYRVRCVLLLFISVIFFGFVGLLSMVTN